MKNPAQFVKITAAFFLALSILCLLIDSFSLLFYKAWMEVTPGTADMMKSMGPVYQWRMDHMDYYYGLHIPGSLVGLVSALGILYKKTWAPRLFSLLLGILILFQLSNLGFSIAVLFTMPDEIMLNGVHFPRGMMMISSGFGSLWSVGILSLYIWLWTVFRKKEVRMVFG